jgi:hypothetical protein
MADGSGSRDSKRLNLIREEPLTKRGERNSALPFFIDDLITHQWFAFIPVTIRPILICGTYDPKEA